MIKSIGFQEGSVVNLSNEIFSLMYSIIAQAAFGKRSKHQKEFISVMVDVLGLGADMYPSVKILERISGMRQKLERTHKQVDEILENILNEHKGKRTESQHGKGEAKEDLVDVLLNVQRSGEFGAPLTDSNLKAVLFGRVRNKQNGKMKKVIGLEKVLFMVTVFLLENGKTRRPVVNFIFMHNGGTYSTKVPQEDLA
ncbi:hypothetical protein ACH5RR_029062 [Cinchona calisaya]|uniref:Uncharacterized protein n=1 Tax=Cinchona calisaya TaxID=153742 RepID=A0ABD2YQK3_9GENT